MYNSQAFPDLVERFNLMLKRCYDVLTVCWRIYILFALVPALPLRRNWSIYASGPLERGMNRISAGFIYFGPESDSYFCWLGRSRIGAGFVPFQIRPEYYREFEVIKILFLKKMDPIVNCRSILFSISLLVTFGKYDDYISCHH